MRALQKLVPVLFGLVLAACTTTGDSDFAASGIPSGTPSQPTVVAASTVTAPDTGSYRVGPQDSLEVSVLQVPDLTRTVLVGENGLISLPLIGNVNAAGKTTDQLKTEIATLYGKSYLQSPRVDVVVKTFGSQRVTVEGAVNKPGIYPMAGSTTLLQAVALAGGVDKTANTRAVVVFRNSNNQRTAAKFDFSAIRSGTANDPVLMANDVVVVDQSGAKAAFRSVIEALPIVGTFGTVLGN